MSANGTPDGTAAPAGFLVPVGGAEKKMREPLILGRFVYVCGARRAQIVVIPTASRLPDTGERYGTVFTHLGARSAQVLDVRTRRDSMRPDAADAVRHASGIFFTGGDQARLAKRICGTPLADAIREQFARGAAVGGTSAGAAFLSDRMIAFGKSGSTPRKDMVVMTRGLGLTRLVIDQHFRQRDRLGRLLTAIAGERGAIGLGLDEDTAAFISPTTMEVVGNGSITVVDSKLSKTCPGRRPGRSSPICLIGLRLHILVHGSTFHLGGRTAHAPFDDPLEVP
jgi:cyanophycinase